MFSFPMIFKSESNSRSGTQQKWKASSYNSSITCSIPPEFGGPGNGFSPEDLYAQALTNCFLATFKVYAEASKVDFENVSVKSQLTVDLNEIGKPVMKDLILDVTILGAKNQRRIQTIAEKAFSSGFILNSVKTNTELKLTIIDSHNETHIENEVGG